MNDIFNWIDKVLTLSYSPDDEDYEILFHLRLAQRLIKEKEVKQNEDKK